MSRRYTIAISGQSSGVERRVTISLPAALATLGVLLTLLLVVGIGAARKIATDTEGLNARYRALDIEKENYRAATEELTKRFESLQSSTLLHESGSSVPAGIEQETRPASPVRGSPVSPALSIPATSSIQGSASRQPSDSASVTRVSPSGAVGADAVDRDSAKPNDPRQLLETLMTEALTRLSQRRALADEANAQTLATRPYQDGAVLETEARQLAKIGRTSDALLRTMAADARFRVAESEARAEAAARERGRPADAPPERPRPAEAPSVEAANLRPVEPARPAAESAAEPTEFEKTIQTVRGVIGQYVSALESKNLVALKKVWPSLGGNQERALRTEFAHARTVQAVFHNPRITINGDTTTVTGLRDYRLETQDGQNLSTTTTTTITLGRVNGEWLIQRVVHSP
jgi:hypothetical protein